MILLTLTTIEDRDLRVNFEHVMAFQEDERSGFTTLFMSAETVPGSSRFLVKESVQKIWMDLEEAVLTNGERRPR